MKGQIAIHGAEGAVEGAVFNRSKHDQGQSTTGRSKTMGSPISHAIQGILGAGAFLAAQAAMERQADRPAVQIAVPVDQVRLDQLAPQLAHHFEQAQNQDKARVYLFKAGEQAAASYANDEALVYFNRALDLTPETETRARFDTLSKRERVFDLQGKRLEQRLDLAELAQLAGQLDDAPVLRAQIAIRQAKLEIDVGDFAAAMSSARAAIQEIEGDAHTRVHAPELLVDALLRESQAMFFAGQAAATKPQLEDALSLAREPST